MSTSPAVSRRRCLATVPAGAAALACAWAPRSAAADPAAANPAAAREQRSRAWFTDTVLIDQDGQQRRFYTDLLAPGEPRVALVHALFTSCSSACPLIVQKLLEVRAALPETAAREFWILSLSIDPLNDTPQQLKSFAAKQGADGPQWRFLTGTHACVARVGRRLGLWVDEPDAHQTTLIAGRASAGHWAKFRPDAPALALAQQLRRFWT